MEDMRQMNEKIDALTRRLSKIERQREAVSQDKYKKENYQGFVSFCYALAEKFDSISEGTLVRLAVIYAAGGNEKMLSSVIEGLRE